MAEILRLENVSRRYREGEGQLEVFRDLSMTLAPGEIVALVGPSGAGKSSLLHMAGLLEAPSAGEVYIDGKAVSRLPEQERTRLRRDAIGFVYQAHYLLPEFDALENVVMPQMIAGKSRAEAREEAATDSDHAGACGAPQSPAGAAFRWRAATRRHRTRLGQPSAHPSGRRAHRQSRPPHFRRGVRRAVGDHPGSGAGRPGRHP